MKRGIELIAEERQRQIDVEGYSEQHDSQHKASTLIYAAIAYVESAKVGVNCAEMGNTNEHEIMMRKAEIGIHYPLGWAFKPSTDVRDLVKAGALIAAAIDRIQLAESEDEKIRKELKHYLEVRRCQTNDDKEYIGCNRFLEWLEKQGEPIDKIVKRAMNEKQRVLLTETNGDANIDWDTRSLQDVKLLLEYGLDYIKKLEKQGEKKPADKVEPKFKVGDWLIFNENHNRAYQVERIDNYRYYLRHYLGGTMSVHFDNELIRPWTIQDAKNGDVLKEDSCIFILEKIKSQDTAIPHCCLFDDGDFNLSSKICFDVDSTYPATKEQRDTLLKAMADAGYTFDFEKKELKKMEQKPEENKGSIGGISSNSEWNEEDEQHIDSLLKRLDALCRNKFERTRFAISEDRDWLKSLRPQNRRKPRNS